MIRLKKFYLEPDVLVDGSFEPVEFKAGINLIIGDKSSEEYDTSQQKKMNSVGKSLFIEFVNFCLLKDYSRSRIARIPGEVLTGDTYACLELEHETSTELNTILIKRSVGGRLPMLIFVGEDGSEFEEKQIENAREYLSHFFLTNEAVTKPTLRRLLSILIRNEKAGYDDILKPDPTSAANSADRLIAPHAYMFGFDLDKIKLVAEIRDQATNIQAVIRDAKARIIGSGQKWQEVRSYIHELEAEVQKLDYSVEKLRPAEGASQLLNEIGELNKQLDTLITEKSSREVLARKIKGLVHSTEDVDIAELKRVYEKYKQGLGDLVSKTFEQTLDFRKQIDEFQNDLMANKLTTLNKEIEDLHREIDTIDSRIAKAYETIGYGNTISDFRVTLRQQQESNSKLERLRSDYELIETKEIEKKKLLARWQQLVNEVETRLFEIKTNVDTFENNLVDLHGYIYGNRKCHFRISVNEKAKKQVLQIDYRTDLDGGASSDRIKTFIYDVRLMLDNYTSKRHPGFLIHDNVFAAVGRNDMVKSLNYLYDVEQKQDGFQYIVAINRDEFESHEQELDFKAADKIVLQLTREHPLLGTQYTEVIPERD